MKSLMTTMSLVFAISHYSEAAPLGSGVEKMPSNLATDRRCSVSLGGELIDYGTQTRWQLQNAPAVSNSSTFGKRTVMLSVICPYTQAMRLTLRGQTNASGNVVYGERGSLVIRLSNAQVDGKSVQIAGSTADGIINDAASDSRLLQPGRTFAPVVSGELTRGKTLTAQLEIEPVIPTADARVSRRQISEARLTMELMPGGPARH
ncbi:hypothetical protein [Pseudomonas fluorescens]